jgi:hypothetical protein
MVSGTNSGPLQARRDRTGRTRGRGAGSRARGRPTRSRVVRGDSGREGAYRLLDGGLDGGHAAGLGGLAAGRAEGDDGRRRDGGEGGHGGGRSAGSRRASGRGREDDRRGEDDLGVCECARRTRAGATRRGVARARARQRRQVPRPIYPHAHVRPGGSLSVCDDDSDTGEQSEKKTKFRQPERRSPPSSAPVPSFDPSGRTVAPRSACRRATPSRAKSSTQTWRASPLTWRA